MRTPNMFVEEIEQFFQSKPASMKKTQYVNLAFEKLFLSDTIQILARN